MNVMQIDRSGASREGSAIYDIGANAAFARRRIIVDDGNPWSGSLDQVFNKLTSLPRGWDGYNGLPVSFTIARFASQVLSRLYVPRLPVPSLVPGADGTIQIEWHTNQYDIELDVLAVNSIIATRYDCLTDHEDVVELSNDVSAPAKWMIELVTPRKPVEAAIA